MTNWITQQENEAVEKVRAELAKPMPDDRHDVGGDDTFDPWAIFPCLYGTYSKAFDDMALAVLRNIQRGAEDRYDDIAWNQETLAHEMFREMLCTSHLCNYGTSPRVCFATLGFREVLPDLIGKWDAFSQMYWSDE